MYIYIYTAIYMCMCVYIYIRLHTPCISWMILKPHDFAGRFTFSKLPLIFSWRKPANIWWTQSLFNQIKLHSFSQWPDSQDVYTNLFRSFAINRSVSWVYCTILRSRIDSDRDGKITRLEWGELGKWIWKRMAVGGNFVMIDNLFQ